MTQMVRVGAVQAEPAWLDLQGGVEKTIALIQQAGKDGVNVLGFPEVWLTGYPWYAAVLSSLSHPCTYSELDKCSYTR
jgi:predicted amidohydrolase